MTKPCKFLKGSCIYCGDTEQGECEGWNPPPKRKEWGGLTFAEVNKIEQNGEFWADHSALDFANAIEAKLKELNHD
jgi:hypothetical protein